MSKYKLKIVKESYKIIFSVIDIEISPDFPANFICILPNVKNFSKSRFAKIFMENGKQIALELLKEALENPEYTNDAEIVKELQKRLKRWSKESDIKIIKKKCQKCHNDFSPNSDNSEICALCKMSNYFQELSNQNQKEI